MLRIYAHEVMWTRPMGKRTIGRAAVRLGYIVQVDRSFATIAAVHVFVHSKIRVCVQQITGPPRSPRAPEAPPVLQLQHPRLHLPLLVQAQ